MPLSRLPRTTTLPYISRSISTTSFRPANSPDWSGRQPSEHVTNRKDGLDVQSSASQSGKKQRLGSPEHEGSSATSQKDLGNQNEQAKKDHPEAPGPVIGMNDERGGVSCPSWRSVERLLDGMGAN